MPALGREPASGPVEMEIADCAPVARPQPTPQAPVLQPPAAPVSMARKSRVHAAHTRPKPVSEPSTCATTPAHASAAGQPTGEAPAALEPSNGQTDATTAAPTLVAAATPSAPVSSHTLHQLMRGPRLLASRNPCAAFFPEGSPIHHGQVQLSIEVDAAGNPHDCQTLLEQPVSQGFANAAIACASHLHFTPALDLQGHPVSAHARIELRFDRS